MWSRNSPLTVKAQPATDSRQGFEYILCHWTTEAGYFSGQLSVLMAFQHCIITETLSPEELMVDTCHLHSGKIITLMDS